MDLLRPTLYDREFYDQQAAGSLASARIVLDAFFSLCPAKSVVDIGCGVGPWVRTAIDLGAADSIGLDGGYVDQAKLLIEADRFHACDLETQNLREAVPENRLFDAVLCMEVAEHLSPARAASFVAELCLLSDVVLFSAAVPGQSGTSHINEQWPEYWSRHFTTSGFDCFDVLRFPLWHEDGCEWWYLQNALVFARQDSAGWRAIAQTAHPVRAPMPLVHPRKLAQLVSNEAGYTIMNRTLEERLSQQHADHTAVLRNIRESQTAERERTQAERERHLAEVARLTDDIERRKAERDATFDATRLWMLRIEREQAAEQALAEKRLASARAALTTAQRQLASALSSQQAHATAYRQLQSDYEALQAGRHDLSDTLIRHKDLLDMSTAEVERLRAQVTALYASTSWRITAPMRAIRRPRS